MKRNEIADELLAEHVGGIREAKRTDIVTGCTTLELNR
jgi:hypothetical protein